MEVYIPSLRKLQAEGDVTKNSWERASNIQDIIIEKPFSIPGVPWNSKILVVAGSIGEIFTKLKARKVIFTDISAKRLREAMGKGKRAFLKRAVFLEYDANFLPFEDDYVDYAVSFEPYPLEESPYFLLQLIRCTRNAIIFLYKSGEGDPLSLSNSFTLKINNVAQMYKLGIEWKKIEVCGREQMPWRLEYNDKENNITLKMNLLKITKEAKQKAAEDLEIIRRADETYAQRDKGSEFLESIRESMNLNRRNFLEALERISLLATERLSIRASYD